jgi:hypothetical protein
MGPKQPQFCRLLVRQLREVFQLGKKALSAGKTRESMQILLTSEVEIT